MITKLRSRVFRLFIYVTYPLLIFGIVALGTLLFVENREVNRLNQTFEEARSSLNKENIDKQITINDLSEEFQAQSNAIASLKEQNGRLINQVSKLEQQGLATISGKILPFISSDSNSFAQFQRVCAESSTNPSVQYCKTVSAVQQTFDLYVDPGTYKVFAEIFPQPVSQESPLSGVKTYYTEYVACVAEQSTAKCDQKKLAKPIVVEIVAGDSLEGINPIDWR